MSNWRIVRGQKYPMTCLFDGDRYVCTFTDISDPDDLDRIVACLNVLHEMPTEILKLADAERVIDVTLRKYAIHVAINLLKLHGYTVTDPKGA